MSEKRLNIKKADLETKALLVVGERRYTVEPKTTLGALRSKLSFPFMTLLHGIITKNNDEATFCQDSIITDPSFRLSEGNAFYACNVPDHDMVVGACILF